MVKFLQNSFCIALIFMLCVGVTAQNAPQFSSSKSNVSATADHCGITTPGVAPAPSREMWDIEYSFDAIEGAQPAIATDGESWYTGSWNPSDFPPMFCRYNMDGSNPVGFSISGVALMRSLTYDGTYFYAGHGGNSTIYKLDLANETLIETITSGAGITRHLTYDPTLDDGNGGFWTGDWTTFAAISMTGTVLIPNSSTPTVASIYGSAYDGMHNCVWLFSQAPGSDAWIYKYDIASNTLTPNVYRPFNDAAGIAGGLFTYETEEKLLLAANVQVNPNKIIVYELALLGDPCPVVTNLETEVQGTDVKLTWTAATGDPTGYEVFQENTSLAVVTETEYFVRNLPKGTYTFSVIALYDEDCIPIKVISDEVKIKPGNPITNLDGNCEDATLTLTWDAPEAKGGTKDEITLQFSGEPDDGIGTNSTAELWPANRWTPEDLEEAGVFSGMVLQTVSFVPQNISGSSAATFNIKVWQGGNWATKDPGTELLHQNVTFTWGVWNEITLDTPIEIDATEELWIGYQMLATSGYPAGCALEAPVVAKGNICWDGLTGAGWCLVSDLNSNLVLNWCIRGKILGEAGVIELSNYDIYQDDVYFDEVEATATSYTATEGVTGSHKYCIVAVYENDAQSEKVCKEVSICSKIKDINAPAFTIVPNPAQNDIIISAGVIFNTVEVINFLGQTVISQTNDAQTVKLDISNLTNGVYFVRIASANGTNVQKFVKQ